MLDQLHQDRIVANTDMSWAVQRLHDAINNIEGELLRPFVLLKPKLSRDGNMYCFLYGDNIQESIAGFGKSAAEASSDFDREWYAKIKEDNNG